MSVTRFWRAAIALILGCLVGIAHLAAQTAGTGAIQGRVFNPASQQYVRNAEIRLEGTNLTTYSENDGSFRFSGVKAGPATITVTYTGSETVKDTFTVTAGQAATRDINMVSALAKDAGTVQLSAFTVSSEREGNAKAIMEQKRNMDITTSVSSDIFGDVTDGNVGEFLKYLPGVDLDYVESEARGPRLGGMDAQYVGVSFDGMRTASADANRGGESSRATSFEGFSITAIESIEISRTTSAESPADSPAGTINMKTKRAFDRKGRSIGYNFGLNFNAEEFTYRKTAGPRDDTSYKWRPNYSLTYSDVYLNQRLGVLLSASRATSYTEQYSHVNDYNQSPVLTGARPDPRPMVIRQINFKDGPKDILKDSALATVDFKATERLTLSLNASYTYTEGEFWNRSFQFVAANNNANVNNGRATVGGDGLLTVRTNSSTTNNLPRINNGDGSSSKLTYTRTYSPKFEYRLDNWLFDGAIQNSRAVNNYEALERGFSSSEGGSAPGDWVATRDSLKSVEWNIRQLSGPDWFNLNSFYNNPLNTNARDGGTRVNNSGRTWITEQWTGRLNAKWDTHLGRFPISFKFGSYWNEESRTDRNQDAWFIWSYVGPGGNTRRGFDSTGAYQVNPVGSWGNVGYVSSHPFDTGTTNGLTLTNVNGVRGMSPRADRQRIQQLFRSNPELFVHTGTPDNWYTSFVGNSRKTQETITAAYSQADIRLTSKLSIRTGLRWENTLNEYTEFDPRKPAELDAAGFPSNSSGRATTFAGQEYQFLSKPKVVRESEYDRWFPSVLAKYNFNQQVQFQAGFNKAIARPPIDQLTGVWNIDEDDERVTAPNPNLLPEFSKNYQARMVYYFNPSGQFSVAVSQNNITNLRESFDYTSEQFGNTDPLLENYIFRSRANSAEARRFRNFEVFYQQTLAFLPDKLRGTNVQFGYTRTYANQRRNNMAPHTITARVAYAYRKFNGSLGFKWSDDKPDGNYGRYKRHLGQFDTQLNYRINSRLSLYVQGRNITSQPVTWYWTPPGNVEGQGAAIRQYQEYGANWVFGVKGNF